MSNKDVTEEQVRIIEIQRSVAKLFIDDLGIHEEDAIRLASRLWCSIHLNHGMFFDRKKDIAALEKFERAIRSALSAIEDEMSKQTVDALIALSSQNGLGSLLENGSSLCNAAKQTRNQISTSERTRDRVAGMNETAINLVSFSRAIWEEETCVPAPRKALNPASRFGIFLADLFDKLEVKGNPQSAFRAWAKHVGDHEVDT